MISGRANILLILFAALLVTLPIVLFGVPKGNDLPQHFQFAVTFRESLIHGDVFPSWSPNVNSGFGDVGVRFYPPLAYYLLVLLYAICSNWLYATAATVCVLFSIGGVAVYLWSREWLGPRASLVGGVLYIFVPYHVNEIYNAFTFAEFAAACILPVCFLYVTRVLKHGAWINTFGLALSFAALMLTHLPMVVVGSISLTVYALALLWKYGQIGKIAQLLVSVGLAMVLTSFYWFRVVSELSFVNHSSEGFVSGAYDFRNNFVWSFFYTSADQYSDRSLEFLDLMLLVTIATAIAGTVVFRWRTGTANKGPMFGLLAVLATGFFFATPLSAPVWERISILQKTQFPWRWMAILSMVSCVMAAAGIDQIKELKSLGSQRIALIMGGLAVATATFSIAQVIRPAIFLDPMSFDKTVEALATANSCECWWPIWAKKAAISDADRVSSTGRNIAIERWRPTERVFQVSAGESDTVRVATFYYPNWQARVNGIEVPVSHDENGVIVIPILAENVRVELFFKEPRVVWIANVISIAAWLFLFSFAAYRLTKIKLPKLD